MASRVERDPWIGSDLETSMINEVVMAIGEDEGMSAITFERVKSEVENDEVMARLREAIINTPAEMRFPHDLSEYNRYRDGLHILEGVPMYGTRVVVPRGLQQEVLTGLHAAHQGVAGMMGRAQQVAFWPGMSKEVENKRNSCMPCDERAPSQAALPPHPIPSPDYPFQITRSRWWLRTSST